MLSKFIGKNGEVFVLDMQRNDCIVSTKDLNNIDNIRFIPRNQGIYKKFKTVISFNEKFFIEEVKRGLIDDLPQKRILIKLSSKTESLKTLQKIKND